MEIRTDIFGSGSRTPVRLLPSDQLGDQDAGVDHAHHATSFEGGPVLEVAFALAQCASRWNEPQEQRGRRQLTTGLEATQRVALAALTHTDVTLESLLRSTLTRGSHPSRLEMVPLDLRAERTWLDPSAEEGTCYALGSVPVCPCEVLLIGTMLKFILSIDVAPFEYAPGAVTCIWSAADSCDVIPGARTTVATTGAAALTAVAAVGAARAAAAVVVAATAARMGPRVTSVPPLRGSKGAQASMSSCRSPLSPAIALKGRLWRVWRSLGTQWWRAATRLQSRRLCGGH